MNDLSPIALFAYKRPSHTEKSLESLSKCEGADESELFIFCDGAKKQEDVEAVNEVRRVVKSRKWCGKVHIIEQDRNLGLANSIIRGVTELCEKYGRVIVLEDDLIVSRYFLNYMNSALIRFENDERVMQISAHMFPVDLKIDLEAVFFPFTTSWGWATWRYSWLHFDQDMKGYNSLKKDVSLRRRFDLDGVYPYFNMLEQLRKGKVDSWAIRWYLSVFMQGGLTLYPTKSFVKNIGFDGSGTHCNNSKSDFIEIETDFRVLTFPNRVEVSEHAFGECKKYLRNIHRGFLTYIKETISTLMQ
ncbi:MAG: sugar transferase [Planctomycetes bacterium RBG_16_43_13]|nr:MAG: sugar transferase [Planctomycetes bacterium RBG_16_43_13]